MCERGPPRTDLRANFVELSFSSSPKAGSAMKPRGVSNWCRCEFVQPITICHTSCNRSSLISGATRILRQMGGLVCWSVILIWKSCMVHFSGEWLFLTTVHFVGRKIRHAKQNPIHVLR